MHLTKPFILKASAGKFSHRILPLALSVVLTLPASAPALLLSCSPSWAADGVSEDVAPSWNEVKSESAKVIESASTKSGAGSSAPAAVNEERGPADGKSIAEAAHNATTTDAAILMPAQVEAQNSASKASEAAASEPAASEPAAAESTFTPTSESSKTADSNSPASNGELSPAASAASSRSTASIDTAGSQVVKAEDAVGATPLSAKVETPGQSSDKEFGDQSSPSGDSRTNLVAPAALTSELIAPAQPADSQQHVPQVGVKGALGTADSLSNDMLRSLGATVTENVTSTSTDADGTVTEGGVMVVDCDEKEQVQDEIKYENLPTDEGKTHIKAGAVFPVVVSSQISSKTAKKGDPIEARLKYDLKIGERVVAHKGAEVHGHINYALHARSAMHSLISPERWYRNSGCLGVEFDEIINEKGEHLPLVACPARTSRIVKNKNEGRVLGVNHLGQITGPWSQQLRYKAVRIGLNAAMAPCGVFSFGAMPVALGLIGAANPSFAFMKPVGQNVRHRRLKGFAWGFLSGVPGSWIIEDTVVKGQESIIKPGDEFLAEFRQEFNGEPASEAQLLPNASVKVHGQVSGKGKKDDKNSK